MSTPDLPLEINVHEAVRLMQGDEAPLVLDVREDAERMACRLVDDLHIPIGQIQANWQNLPRDQHLLVYCHHGMRSLRVAQFLKMMGFSRVQSIRGGIEAWSLEVDPSVPRY
ncbi:MAG TPA: rhodanese-like domain-containing protein [Oceanipulchritudo sp.]|nr:rhodanese-like domain-containing protein [Oceanipulchritudo sp.]